jgi:hypothetical protein
MYFPFMCIRYDIGSVLKIPITLRVQEDLQLVLEILTSRSLELHRFHRDTLLNASKDRLFLAVRSKMDQLSFSTS